MNKVILVKSLALALLGTTLLSAKGLPNEHANSQATSMEKGSQKSHSLAGMTAALEAPGAKISLEKAKKHWLKAKKNRPNKNDELPTANLFDTLHVGYGGASAYDFYPQEGTGTIWMSTIDLALDENIGENPYYRGIRDFEPTDFSELQQQLKNSKYIIYWLPKNWNESWFSISQIQLAMDEGYVPVFMYWYFGDHLVDGLPNEAEVQAYHANNAKVSNFLSQLNGEKMIIMEPEFNKNLILESAESQDAFASLISSGIDNVKVNNPEMLVSLCMTDAGNRSEENIATYCGYENCALGDQYSWSKPERIYNQLLDKIDFISFQQMVAQFSRDPLNPGTWSNPNPKAYTENELGINLLAQRINNMTAFLHTKYDKPVFLPYMTVATATWNDVNVNGQIESTEVNLEGWEEKASRTYENLFDLRGELQRNGLFGYAPMALFDHPRHDQGGYQYFLHNEYHLGVTKTNAQDGVDAHLLGDVTEKSNILNFIY